MGLCDELLTIVVIALVNQFVHSRVPTAVRKGTDQPVKIIGR